MTDKLPPRSFSIGSPRLVCVESAYAGAVKSNRAFLRDALLDSISRGEAPYASHAYLPDVLDDGNTAQRALGMQVGHAWAKQAACFAIYLREHSEKLSRGVVERLALVAPAQDMTPIVVRVADSPQVFGEPRSFTEWHVVGRDIDAFGAALLCVPADSSDDYPAGLTRVCLSAMTTEEAAKRLGRILSGLELPIGCAVIIGESQKCDE